MLSRALTDRHNDTAAGGDGHQCEHRGDVAQPAPTAGLAGGPLPRHGEFALCGPLGRGEKLRLQWADVLRRVRLPRERRVQPGAADQVGAASASRGPGLAGDGEVVDQLGDSRPLVEPAP